MAKKAKKKKAAKVKKQPYGHAKGTGHLGFKVDGPERAKIKANANKYAGGNVSAWLVHSAIHHKGNAPFKD